MNEQFPVEGFLESTDTSAQIGSSDQNETPKPAMSTGHNSSASKESPPREKCRSIPKPNWIPTLNLIPQEPGVYKFLDEYRRVIYVGKAKNLRQRLSSYFVDPVQLYPKTRQMIHTARQVEWTVVNTEVEALQLEYTWIKQFDPRFNIRFKDDKSYPMLAVTLADDYPRFCLYRGELRPKVRYFGPFSHAWAIRNTLDIVAKIFQVRTCTQGVFKRHRDINRPCLLGYIEKCSAPCVNRISPAQYRVQVNAACSFLAGKTDKVTALLQDNMRLAAEQLEFETAARLRDTLYALEKALEKQTVVFTDKSNADVVGIAHDDLEVAIEIFHVREGKVSGQHGWIIQRNLSEIPTENSPIKSIPSPDSDDHNNHRGVSAEHKCTLNDIAQGDNQENVPEISTPTDLIPEQVQSQDSEILRECLVQFYSKKIDHEKTMASISITHVDNTYIQDIPWGATDNLDPATDWIQSSLSPIPQEILVPFLPYDTAEIEQWLSQYKGSKLAIRVPQRGDKKILLDTVQKNALTALERHRLRRIGDVNARSAALTELMHELNLPSAPLRIECVDISHLQGTDVVGSLVVFEDGLPKKNDYRHYTINNAFIDGKINEHSNDLASIAEVTTRRFTRYLQEKQRRESIVGSESECVTVAKSDVVIDDSIKSSGSFTAASKQLDHLEPQGKISSFSYPPNLYIVDGGAMQVKSAYESLQALGIEDIAVIGIAKRLEEIWLPHEEFPIIFPRNSPALFLLQHIRDEAHRFAIGFHRTKRSKRLTESRLDTITGIGAQRKSQLVQEFGSVANLLEASIEDIARIPGIGPKTAERIFSELHAHGSDKESHAHGSDKSDK